MPTQVKIEAVAAASLQGVSPKGGWSVEIQPEDSIHAVIAVHTDAGITGYGSVFTDGRLARAGLQVLEPLLIGENALEPERVSEKLHQNTFWMGRGGTLTHVISGIDLALWDILGKSLHQPVGRLLGGTYRTRAKPYCSLLMTAPDSLRDSVAAQRERGFRAFKIGWGPFGRAMDHRVDEALVRAAREAAGTDAMLLVDAGASDAHWPRDLKWAIRASQMLADYNVGWFEEPLRPDAIEDYVHLRRVSPVPIATGEVLTRRQSFVPWFSQGAMDIVQPDVTKVGGLSEQRRIAWLADDFNVDYVGHGWNTAIGLAADLQLCSALPKAGLVEFIHGSPYLDQLMSTPFDLDSEGLIAIPQEEGLGISIDRDRIGELTPDAHLLFRD